MKAFTVNFTPWKDTGNSTVKVENTKSSTHENLMSIVNFWYAEKGKLPKIK